MEVSAAANRKPHLHGEPLHGWQSRDLLALLSPPLCDMHCSLASVAPEI